MRALMRNKDWSASALGKPEDWPDALRTALGIALSSRFPMVLWWGPDLIMLYNDAWRPVLGVSKHPHFLGEPGQKAWPEIWHIIGPMLESVMRTGEATWVDDQLLEVNRNGYVEEAYFTYSYSPIHLPDGSVGGVFSAVHETTERVVSERRMQILREVGAAAVDADPVTVTIGKILQVMRAYPASLPFAAIYSRTGELIESTEPLPPELAPAWLEFDNAVPAPPFAAEPLEGGGWVGPVERFGVSSAAWHEVVRQAVLLPLASSDQSQPAGFLLVGVNPRRALDSRYRDFLRLLASHTASAIQSSQAYEQEVQRARELAELDRAKNVFFSEVSHEFRTPLTLMLGPLEQMLEGGHDKRTDLQLIYRNGQRLLKLVNNLLDFSRLEAGRYQAHFAPADIAAATREIAASFHSAFTLAGLEFEVITDEITGDLYLDQDIWEKVLLNLLSNALKYTREGRVRLVLKDGPEAVTLEVKDTGIGIPADELDRLFTRFYRVHSAHARTQEGSGIGLSLVRELVQLHGGTIGVESRVAEGSSFVVTLPKGTAHLPAERVHHEPAPVLTSGRAEQYLQETAGWLPSAKSSSETSLSTNRVLIVDDNADMRDYLARTLESFCTVETANSGRQAIETARSLHPQLIISDVMMPEMDGLTLLETIREDETLRDTRVLLLSARAGQEARFEGLERGADDYLVKPFSPRELQARVRRLLANISTIEQLQGSVQARTNEVERMARLLSDFVETDDFGVACREMMQMALDITSSEYGFIGPMVEGGPFGQTLRVFSYLGFRWSPDINHDMYAKIESDFKTRGYIDFPALDNLFGWPILHARPIIVNNTKTDPRRSGRQPAGHPPLNNFLGIPIFKGDTVVGTIGVANREAGYDDTQVTQLELLSRAASVIFESYRRRQQENLLREDWRAAEENLRRANQSLLDLAYTVSHELQEPLQLMRSQLSMLNARYADRLGTDADDFIGHAYSAAARVSRMVDDLWEYARIDRPHVKFEPVNMNEIFDKVVITIESTIAERGARVTRGDLPRVKGEKRRLGLMLQQLLCNAIQFNRSAVPEVDVQATALLDEWSFCCRDNGIGFDSSDANEIFKMFRKLDRESPGSGMGLALARRTVEFHGGRMWAEASPGQGARFYFTLPLATL